jgi:hypothetical protein
MNDENSRAKMLNVVADSSADRQDLKVQSRTRPQHAVERRQNGDQHQHHREQSLAGAVGKFNGFNTYDIFSVHSADAARTRY